MEVQAEHCLPTKKPIMGDLFNGKATPITLQLSVLLPSIGTLTPSL